MSDITTRLYAQINKTYYAFERYNVDATFGIIYLEDSLPIDELGKMVRITDQLIPLDANHYFIIYTYTKEETAYKASQNLLLKLDYYLNNHTSCIALKSLDIHQSAENVVRRLKQILAVTRQNSFSRIENETILDSY